ncbi:class I SAM-dependent methyltransferase [Tenacibaculum finnmarkense]|uniref:class I SAM-dependent methyltransferase n=1 Tax=Tenacibaculum finnmarkense TaxID=2781243 RepID=UPI001E5B0873|nr:class I SAM-dependent methyltransferase [Tenacibaculum finnmarkense]MCD8413613.1 class I SAM-dependent methyltransferase [Tenacibaculum finnmarkense genomovar ulcerans]MCG8208362.1 class I SAM-dependent methyltransferase [Tenacibaculum finnmarkense genomovar finnmarkense]MCG8724318.1 class I SAM-dependent methyltransferase [Tenacibaculum finnmarkense]MCG8742637.1 class I SAM-dependent methyltransferase [Tenacibaculum finnmarkense]MCG8766036.1 class I SAM-dependent methyltransferase [Tenacib
MTEHYEPKFVEKLFDKMSSSYSRMNYITSFGFSERWRKQCVNEIEISNGKVIVDLLTGMGECWKFIDKKANKEAKIIGIDFSTEMIKKAENNKGKFKNRKIELLKENVFKNSIKENSVDTVISGFGLKTFDNEQLTQLAKEINRMLKPNGNFSLIDVSVPKNRILKIFYVFYLKYIIPILGKLFLGNVETYKMLGVYTNEFDNSRNVENIFKNQNFEVEYVEYFYGCASGIKGMKRDSTIGNKVYT